MARGNGKASARAVAAASATHSEVRKLPVRLEDTTLLDRADEMAECELRIEQLGLQRSQLNDGINKARKRRLELGRIIDSGEEDQEVRCEWRADHAKAVWRLYRTDSGTVIDERTMTAEDMQTSLTSGDGEPLAPPVPPARSPASDKPARRPRKAAAAAPASSPPPAAAASAPPRIRTRKATSQTAVGPADIVA